MKEADISLSKSEEWNDDDTITWKVDINSTSKTAFTELTLQDEIVLGETLGAHSFIKDEDGKMWSVVEKPSGVEVEEEEVGVGENSNGQLKIRNFAAGKITLTVKTRIDRNSFKDSTFGNKVVLTGTGLPDNGQLEDTATVSNVNLRLKKQFVKADGDNFNWQVNFNTVGIVDPTGWDLNETLTGPHKFVDEESFVLIDQDGNKIDRTVTIAVDGKSAVIKLTGSDENLTGKFFTLTYQTQYDPDFTPGANESSTTVNNKVTWSKGVPGEDDEIGDAGNEVGIGEKNISASSLADRTVDWEITYNLNKYEVKKGSIVDTLPGGFTLVDVVNPQNSVSIKDDEGNDISSDNYTVALEGNKVTINFINPGVISKKTLLVTINSKYDPEDKNLEALSKNKATLSMNGQTQDVYADFQIPKIIHANGFKDGTVNIPDQDYSKAYVRWRIGINTHALDTWTNGQVIKIDDVLNDGGQNYLSFDGDQDFKLYAQQLGPTGLGDEIELTEDQYEITNDDAGNITITLINVGNFDKSSLRLDFNTPIDFGDKKLESDKWTFKNNADITYGSEVDKRKLKVSAEVSHANSGFYIDKRHISTTGGTIKWQSVINGGGKNLEEYDNVTITDTMAEGLSFLNSTSNPIELYEAQMNSAGQYESTGKKVGTDSYSLEPVDGGEGFKIVFDKDYRVTSPLILTYYSQVEKKMEAYKNTIKLSYTGSEFDAEDEIKSEHFGAGHFTRFALNLTKVDANDGKPLEGAEFKVQRAKFRNGVTPTDADFEDFVVNDKVMEGTTDINGRLNFGQLDSMDWYRVVEVTPPGGYQPGYISELHRWSGSGNPSIKSEVKNNELKYGTLQIKKTVSNPGTTNDTFDFEVIGRGPNLEDGTPELLNGDFKATFYEKDGVAVTRSVTFEGGKLKNGIKLKDGEQLFIQGLETRFKFDITEQNPDGENRYTTKVSVDNLADVDSRTVEDVEIKSNDTTTVHFTNTRKVTNFRLKKIASDGNSGKSFNFTIQSADENVKEKNFQTRLNNQDNGRLTFNEDGVARVTLYHNDELEIVDLPEEAKLTIIEDKDEAYNASWRIGNDDYEQGNETDEINVSENQLATFLNTPVNTGNLSITKDGSANIASDKEFIFEVSAVDDENYAGSAMAIKTNENGSSTTQNIKFDNGKTQIKLKLGQMVTISDLKLQKYQVSELSESDDPYQTKWRIDSSEFTDGKIADAVELSDDRLFANYEFHNHLPETSLEIEKQVTGKGDQSKEFKFAIVNTNGTLKNKSYAAKVDDRTMQLKFTEKDGEVWSNTFNLKHNQKMVVEGLSEEAQIKVVEIVDKNSMYDTSWKTTNDDNDSVDNGSEITEGNEEDYYYTNELKLEDGNRYYVDYVNDLSTSELEVEKKVTGKLGDIEKGFKFAIVNTDGKLVNRSFDVKIGDENRKITFKAQGENSAWAEFTLRNGQRMQLEDLPSKAKVKIVEIVEKDSLYDTSWKLTDKEDLNVTGDFLTEGDSDNYYYTQDLELESNNKYTVVYTNHLPSTSLEVEKQVTGQSIQNDLEKEFRFELINTDGELKDKNVVGYIGDKKVTLNFKSREAGGFWSGEFKLKHGEKLVLPNLPDKISMRAVEYGEKNAIYETSWQVIGDGVSDSGSTPTTAGNYRTNAFEMKDQGEYKVLFTNHKPSTDFELRKIITDAEDEELEETSKFNLQFTNDKVAVAGTYETIDQDKQTGKIVIDKEGNATALLGHKQSLRIVGLPTDTKVTVDEQLTDEQLPYYKPSWSIGDADPVRGTTTTEITLDGKDELTSVLYDNWYDPGDLFISKKLAGSYTTDDKQDSFKYTVTAYNSDSSVNTSFNYEFGMTVNRQNGSFEERIKFNSGVATVNLRADESVQIEKIPTNTLLRVTESNYAGYTPSYQINQGASVDGDTTSLITIVDDKVQEVDFTNRRPEVPSNGMLTLSKRVTGDNAETDRLFDFTLNIQNADGSGFTGTLNYTFRTAFSSTLGQLPVINGNATMSLKHGDSVQFMLPTGTHYQITEDDYSGDGYTTSAVVNNTTVNDLTVSGTILENSANVVTYMNSMEEPEFPNEGGDEDDSEEAQAPTDESSSSPTVPNAGGSEGTGTSGTTGTGGGTAASGSGKGILPQTAEFLANNWLILLGGFILLNLIAWHIRNRYYKPSK